MTLKYEHLLGLEFDQTKRNCWHCTRDFFQTNFKMKFLNYAAPTDWWKHGLNLYNDFYYDNGFRPLDVHPSEWRDGDVVLMAIRSKVGNHSGVLVNGKLLHHFWGQRSSLDQYAGMWRTSTLNVFRHKDIDTTQAENEVSIMDLIPEHRREKIENAIAAVSGR